jgi:carbon monoxide dehydrogenase subunit G
VSVGGGGNTWTFILPAFDVTVDAEFEFVPENNKVITVSIPTAHGTVGTAVAGSTASSAAPGASVTLRVTLEAGYKLKSGFPKVIKTGDTSAVPEDIASVTVDANTGAGTYTFTMPGYPVTVTAEFEGIPDSVTSLTLTNLPATITGEVAVGLSAGNRGLDAIGPGTVSGGSVTVTLYHYTGDDDDPYGDPWTGNGGSYQIILMYGEDYVSMYYSPEMMSLPNDGIIDTEASGFVFDGPTGSPVGHITGSLTISNIPNIPINRIYLHALQYDPADWNSWQITLKNKSPTSGTLTQNFDIPLYNKDSSGSFSTTQKVFFAGSIEFSDGTHWELYFDNNASGWSVPAHNATTALDPSLSGAMPATQVVTGTANITIEGATVQWAEVGIRIAGDGFWMEGMYDGTWKIRVLASSTGTFMVRAEDTAGNRYRNETAGSWAGAVSDNTVNFVLKEADKRD